MILLYSEENKAFYRNKLGFGRNPFGVFKNYASVVQEASQPSKATSKATSQTSSESTGLLGFEVFFYM